MTRLEEILSNALEPGQAGLLRAPEKWCPKVLAQAFEKIGTDREAPILRPDDPDRLADALKALLGQGVVDLGRFQHVILAYNLALPHELLQGKELLASDELMAPLLDTWRTSVSNGGGLFVWRGALLSYFRANTDARQFPALRQFLSQTLGAFSERKICPVWLQVMNEYPELIRENSAEELARLWIDGESGEVVKLKEILDIPDSSWFWSEFVGAVLRKCCDTPDDSEFRSRLRTALGLLKSFEQHSNQVLLAVVNRYALSAETPRHDRLLAIVLDAWGSPQLGFDGNKHKWSGASSKAIEMVCSWLAEEDLEDFREYCKGDESVDDRRLAYWLRYKKQITFSKLILGRTIWNAGDRRTRAFIARKRGRLSQLSSVRNALVLRIGKWWFVEFSEKGKACCPYREGCGYEFDFSLPVFSEGELRSVAAIEASGGIRLIHRGDWEASFDSFLASKRIWPDAVVLSRNLVKEKKLNEQSDIASGRKRRPPPASLGHEDALSVIIASLNLDKGSANLLKSVATQVADNRKVGGRLWIELSDSPAKFLQIEMLSLGYAYAAGRGFYWTGT